MRYTETILKADDGHRLFVRHFQCRQPQENRTLLVAHGVAEHGARYRHLAGWFLMHGWNVVITDHRGHGWSEGVPTHVNCFDDYARDLEQVRQFLGLQPLQTATVGHSMGGLVCVRHAQLYPDSVRAMILLSPLLRIRVPIPLHTRALARFLSWVRPQTRFRSRVDPTEVVRCPDALARRLQDELMHGSVTAGWFYAVQNALRDAWREAPWVRTPLLVLQAGADCLVDPAAPEEWLATAGSFDSTLHRFPGRLHELLNEPDWPRFATEISRWLEARWQATMTDEFEPPVNRLSAGWPYAGNSRGWLLTNSTQPTSRNSRADNEESTAQWLRSRFDAGHLTPRGNGAAVLNAPVSPISLPNWRSRNLG